ncbi:Imm8 family immunity protein [Actinomycetota bacterium]
MRAVLKNLDLEPDPASLPNDPAEFSLLARMIVGPADMPGEESFDVIVCTPEWLAKACSQVGGIYNARHHLVVNFDGFDQRALRAWLSARVREVEADTWAEVGHRLGRLASWEFEDYRD